ncbi:aminotransferase class V-fold PLP-dependent enzyme [Undibacterium sp. Di24W]|uniref:aminotransferase class V-fold PLP-dependent enzyme n=1 Tax=Undibacterium sp. Di24W TaxID=3413033 RepID=UPI003BF206D4
MNQTNAHIAADNDEYWAYISAHFPTPTSFTNLENAYCGMLSQSVMAALQRYQTEINVETSYFLRTRLHDRLDEVNNKLAEFCGIAVDELLITRNLTEALHILLRAYPFNEGDEILYANADYDSVQQLVEDIASRKQLSTRIISITSPLLSDEDIVKAYENAITENTRVIMLTHLLHRNGQIMPVAKIAKMAKRYKVDVIVDAAHSFAQLNFQLPDLESDFIGVNLHKWLGAPLGTGLLYVRRQRIAELTGSSKARLRSLIPTGTFSPAPVMAIVDAIRFHQSIGTRNIEERLRHLSQYWLQQVCHMAAIKHHTPVDPKRHCAIIAISISGIPAQEVVDYLMQEHQIFTVTRTIEDQEVVRITPHIFTSKSDLDRLVEGLRQLIEEKQSFSSQLHEHEHDQKETNDTYPRTVSL